MEKNPPLRNQSPYHLKPAGVSYEGGVSSDLKGKGELGGIKGQQKRGLTLGTIHKGRPHKGRERGG